MTEVCLVAAEDLDDLADELFSYPTARAALAAYDLRYPFENAVALDTVSLGAAVSLLNDLDWYLARLAREGLVREPSIDDREWLSRALATAVRDGRRDPGDTGDRLKVYGVVDGRLVEPMFATRADGVPEYDLRDVEDTLVVRIAESEFG